MLKIPKLCKTMVFDSNKGESLDMYFKKDIRWIIKFTSLRFTLPPVDVGDPAVSTVLPYTKPIAYLKITASGASFETSSVYQNYSVIEGVVLPVADPDTRARVDGMVKGNSTQGMTSFKISMLDEDFKPLETSRIVIIGMIDEEL